jgi:hypothetical protein
MPPTRPRKTQKQYPSILRPLMLAHRPTSIEGRKCHRHDSETGAGFALAGWGWEWPQNGERSPTGF